jgi:hypothetical protein
MDLDLETFLVLQDITPTTSFSALPKFAHVESRVCNRKRQGKVVSYASVNLCVRKICSYKCRCRVTSLPHVIKHGGICLLRNLSLTRCVKAIYAVTV